jgi:uncharacterized protein (DUF58 family)
MSFVAALHTRIGNWSRRRHGVDSEPALITSRRVYILPTRLGLMYAVTVFAMALGGMNYGNNLAMGLAFILGSLGFVAMHHCHRNLAGLSVRSVVSEPVFAGQLAHLQLAIENSSPQARFAIQAEADKQLATPVHIACNTQVQALLPQLTQRRGWLRIERLTLSTRYPFGLFRAWTVLHLELKCLVYPKPSERSNTPPPAQFDTRNTQDLQRGDDDFAGLRSFHPGDSPTRIAWKAYAREQGLLVKLYAGAAITSCVLDWDSLAGLDAETRLSRLCRWIVDAHQQGIAYGLKLPGLRAAPQISAAHRNRCLSALALLGV